MNNANMQNPIALFQQFISMGTNPQQVEQMIFAQNPQLQVIANQMKQSGLTPMQFVQQYAKQNNISMQNINPIYQQMLNMISKR